MSNLSDFDPLTAAQSEANALYAAWQRCRPSSPEWYAAEAAFYASRRKVEALLFYKMMAERPTHCERCKKPLPLYGCKCDRGYVPNRENS